jgi:hypothetical protein
MGFSVTPYQAFWHPRSPVYAPKAAKLQLLAPVAENTITFESQLFDIANCATNQTFMLPFPLVSVGGVARIVLLGMHQRQTITSGMMDEAHDDYYICLSHAQIIGKGFPDFSFSSSPTACEIRAVQ